MPFDACEEPVPHLGLAEEDEERPSTTAVEPVADCLEEFADRLVAHAAHGFHVIETEHDGNVRQME